MCHADKEKSGEETTERIGLQNQKSIRTLGNKRKFQEIMNIGSHRTNRDERKK